MTALGWWRTIPVLADAGFRAISFDNRGIGRSHKPPGPYSVPEMADDALGVLAAVGEERTAVYGISLGGMIAQEIALRHPERVTALVLGATTPGGEDAVPVDEATLAFFRRRAEMTAEDAVWASVPYNYAARTRREKGQAIAEDIERRLRLPVEREGYEAQLGAALGHDAVNRLGEIGVPTLVVHGEEDRMVPVANAHLMADRIPAAELSTWSDAAHLYFTDEPRIDHEVAAFLRRALTDEA